MSLVKLSTITKLLKEELSDNRSNFYTNRAQFEKEIKETFREEYEKYPAVFTVILSEKFNIEGVERLEFMLGMASKVEDKNITEHDASVEVGQRLVDDIVKPQLDNK